MTSSEQLEKRIVIWMGEEHEYRPEYTTRSAAALRVLARMNKYGDYHLTCDKHGEFWFVVLSAPIPGKQVVRKYWRSKTPSAAICSAWREDFGGEE